MTLSQSLHHGKEIIEHGLHSNRRRFLSRLGWGVGQHSAGSLLIPDLFKGNEEENIMSSCPCLHTGQTIIYLFQNGAPSQLDLFDYKPLLQKMQGEELPASVRLGQRLTG